MTPEELERWVVREARRTRELTLAEVDARWFGALVLFDRDCAHLHNEPNLGFWSVKGKLQARTNRFDLTYHNDGMAPRGRAYWNPQMQLWIRCSACPPVRPYRDYSRDLRPSLCTPTLTVTQRRWHEIPEMHTPIEPLRRALEEVLASRTDLSKVQGEDLDALAALSGVERDPPPPVVPGSER